jgi:hypothetical protein
VYGGILPLGETYEAQDWHCGCHWLSLACDLWIRCRTFVAVLMISPRASNFWINIALRIPYVLCPVLLLSDSSSTWWYLSPLTNAALYGVIAYLWLRVRKAYAN